VKQKGPPFLNPRVKRNPGKRVLEMDPNPLIGRISKKGIPLNKNGGKNK